MLVQGSNESLRAFLGFRLSTDTISAKTVFFDTFFTNWIRGSTLQMLRQAKKSQRVAPLVTALPQALNWPLGIMFCRSYSFGKFRLI